MSCSKPARLVIDTGQNYKLPVPYVAMGDGRTKEDTVFVMADRANGLSIMGTFDEILSFASSIVAAMYSWPILANREDWLGEPVTPDTNGADIYVIHNQARPGNPGDGGSGTGIGGDGSDAA